MLKNPKKADLDKDGTLTSYEKKRGKAPKIAIVIQDKDVSKNAWCKFICLS